MPTTAYKQLVSIGSPVTLANIQDEAGTFVKGFASTLKTDRSGDLVPPDAFSIDRFLASPTVLVNHKYWIDPRGNPVSVGKVVELFAAVIEDIDSEDEWGIKEIPTDKAHHTSDKDNLRSKTFPKANIPDLGPGDYGLFSVVKVTNPEIEAKVNAGELSAFSWKGTVEVRYSINPETGRPQKVFKDVDLVEISLVDTPDNPHSTFVVGKSNLLEDEDGDLVVHAIELEKGRFETADQARAYLKAHGFDLDLRDADEKYYSRQIKDRFPDNLHRVRFAPGVFVFAGPHTPSTHEVAAWEVDSVVAEPEKMLTSARTIEEESMSTEANTLNLRISLDQGDEAATVESVEKNTDVADQTPCQDDLACQVAAMAKSVEELVAQNKGDETVETEEIVDVNALADAIKQLSEKIEGLEAKSEEEVAEPVAETEDAAKSEEEAPAEEEEKEDTPEVSETAETEEKSEETPEVPEVEATETVAEEKSNEDDVPAADATPETEMEEDALGAMQKSFQILAETIDNLNNRIDSVESMFGQTNESFVKSLEMVAEKIDAVEAFQNGLGSAVISKSTSRSEESPAVSKKTSFVDALVDSLR